MNGDPDDDEIWRTTVSAAVGQLLITLGEKVREAGVDEVRIFTSDELEQRDLAWLKAGWEEHARAREDDAGAVDGRARAAGRAPGAPPAAPPGEETFRRDGGPAVPGRPEPGRVSGGSAGRASPGCAPPAGAGERARDEGRLLAFPQPPAPRGERSREGLPLPVVSAGDGVGGADPAPHRLRREGRSRVREGEYPAP